MKHENPGGMVDGKSASACRSFVIGCISKLRYKTIKRMECSECAVKRTKDKSGERA